MEEHSERVTFPSTLTGAAEERMLRRFGAGDCGASGKGREHALHRASSESIARRSTLVTNWRLTTAAK